MAETKSVKWLSPHEAVGPLIKRPRRLKGLYSFMWAVEKTERRYKTTR